MSSPQPLTFAELAATFAGMHILDASPDKRLQLVRRLLDARFSRRHLVALVRKVSGAVLPGGLAVKILHGDWRTELEAPARVEAQKGDPEARYSHTEEQTRNERTKRSGMTPVEFERNRRTTIAIEQMHFGRTLIDGDGTPRREFPTEEQLAAELGMTPEEFHAAVLDRAKRTADAAAAAAPASKPRALGALQLVADKPAEVETEREAITEESETSVDTATRHPLPNKHRLNPTPGPGNSVPDVWNQQLVEADRAWAERFSMFRFVDRQANKQALAGPEPRPWVERAIRASADRIAGKNPKWSGRHADHRPRAK